MKKYFTIALVLLTISIAISASGVQAYLPTCFQLFCALFSVRISREFYEYLLFALEIYCADAALRCLGRTP